MNISTCPIQNSCRLKWHVKHDRPTMKTRNFGPLLQFLRVTSSFHVSRLRVLISPISSFNQLAFFSPLLQLHAQCSHTDSKRVRGLDPMPAELLEGAENDLL